MPSSLAYRCLRQNTWNEVEVKFWTHVKIVAYWSLFACQTATKSPCWLSFVGSRLASRRCQRLDGCHFRPSARSTYLLSLQRSRHRTHAYAPLILRNRQLHLHNFTMANASSEVPHIGPLENSSVATLPTFFSRLLISRPAPATRTSTASANLHYQPSPIQSERQSLHMRICDKELLGLPTELELHPAFKNEYSLITILPVPNDLQILAFWLRERIHQFLEIDDVFSKEFLAGVMFKIRPDGQLCLADDVSSLLASWGTHLIGIVQDTAPATSITAGPHLIAHRKVWQTFGVQDDTNSTFVSAFVPRLRLG